MTKFVPSSLAWLILAYLCLPVPLYATEPYPIPSDTLVVLQSGPCEMECPVYRVIIFSGGDVIWNGINNVRKKGLALGHITFDQTREIIDALNSIDYLHLQNIYGFRGKGCSNTKNSMHAYVTYTWITIGGASNSLQHDSGCTGETSERLSLMENKINQVTDTAQWIK